VYCQTPSQAIPDRWYSISPSAYVVYTSVSASNQCGRVGGTISRTTLAFDPGDLSTWNIPPRSLPNPRLATNIPFTGKSTQLYIMHASSRLTVAAIDYAELARHALPSCWLLPLLTQFSVDALRPVRLSSHCLLSSSASIRPGLLVPLTFLVPLIRPLL
jgi:hypothetical protein